MAEAPTEKICCDAECAHAGVPQPIAMFHRNRTNYDGRASLCRECSKRRHNRAARKYRQERRALGEALVVATQQGGDRDLVVRGQGNKPCENCPPDDADPGTHWHARQGPRGGWVKHWLCLACYIGFIGFRDDPRRMLRAATTCTAPTGPTQEAHFHQFPEKLP